jgi:hypothetical protein
MKLLGSCDTSEERQLRAANGFIDVTYRLSLPHQEVLQFWYFYTVMMFQRRLHLKYYL